jgi:hypothetical protein
MHYEPKVNPKASGTWPDLTVNCCSGMNISTVLMQS